MFVRRRLSRQLITAVLLLASMASCSKRGDQRVDIKPKSGGDTDTSASKGSGVGTRDVGPQPSDDRGTTYAGPPSDPSPPAPVTDPSISPDTSTLSPGPSMPADPSAVAPSDDRGTIAPADTSTCVVTDTSTIVDTSTLTATASGGGSACPVGGGSTFNPSTSGTGSSPWSAPGAGGIGGLAGGPDPSALGRVAGTSTPGELGTSLGNFFAAMQGHAATVDPDQADLFGLLASFSQELPVDGLFQRPANGGFLTGGGSLGSEPGTGVNPGSGWSAPGANPSSNLPADGTTSGSDTSTDSSTTNPPLNTPTGW